MKPLYNKIINKLHQLSQTNKKEINRKVGDINNNDSYSKEKLLQLVKNKTEKIPKIQSPDEVKKIMEDLWLNHKAGNKALNNNIFMVKLPSLENKGQKNFNFHTINFEK